MTPTEAVVAARLPDFVIVGAGRSGSTALFQKLRAHPQVFMPREKELHFFNKDEKWAKGVEWYQQFFADAGEGQVLGDATPSYMYDARAAERMVSVIPGARLVATLRNPVDRAYSHWWMNHSRGIDRLSFEEAVQAEPDRLRRDPRPRWAYVDRGRYVHQLRRLCRHFPRQHLLVLVFEDELRASPEATYAGVCRFIGVDDAFVPAGVGEPVNAARAIRSARLRHLTRVLPRPLRPLTRAVARVNERPLSYPPMDPGTRARLAAGYEADNAALAAWLGRDLAAWR